MRRQGDPTYPSPEQGEVGRGVSRGSMGGAPKSRNKAQTQRQKALSRNLRQNTTDAEALLWWALRDFRRTGTAFRRQVAVGPYVADFLCRKANLIVELDGDHHARAAQSGHDARRDAWLDEQGYRVLRFWNADVFNDLDSVILAIQGAVREGGTPPSDLAPLRVASPPSPARGRDVGSTP